VTGSQVVEVLFAAAGIELPAEAISKLNSIGTTQRFVPWDQR
jgi:hypothetical protein